MRDALLPVLAFLGCALTGPVLQPGETGAKGQVHGGSPGHGSVRRAGFRRSRLSLAGPLDLVASSRPLAMPAPFSNRVLAPEPLARCLAFPGQEVWQSRDLLKEIRALAREGFVPVTAVGDVAEFQDTCPFPSGWKAYAFVVPGGEKLHVRLRHPNEGWFRLIMVDRWGWLREGMLRNLIPTGEPEVTFRNPRNQPDSVYVIVDDPGWMSCAPYPYTIQIDRSWDPARSKTPELPAVLGIWAETQEVEPGPGRAPAPAPRTPAT